LRLHGGPNLFAEVPDFTLECPERGTFHVRGGHRFWLAPEDPARSYRPDDAPVEIETLDRGLIVTASEDRGLLKSIRIAMPDERRAGGRRPHSHQLPQDGGDVRALGDHRAQDRRRRDPAAAGRDRGRTPEPQLGALAVTDIRSPFIAWGNEFTLVTGGPRIRARSRSASRIAPAGWRITRRGCSS